MRNHDPLILDKLGKELELLRGQLAAHKERISALERRVRLQRSFRAKFRSALWDYRQYEPRALRVPESYRHQATPGNTPRIAIVTPTLNSANFLAGTVNSVLEQAYPNLGYVVQDGGSKDGTQELLGSYRNKLLWRSQPDLGQADAINNGFKLVSGDIMAYLNSDDVLLPGALAYVAQAFVDNPEVDIVYGNRITIDEEDKEIGRIVLPPHDKKVIKWIDFIPQETMFWRRRVWERIGPLDISFSFAMDWDFILRAQAAGFRFRRLSRFLACFRVHHGQKTISISDVGREEQERLRQVHLGANPSGRLMRRKVRGYLFKQVLFQRLYKLGVLKL